MSAAQIKVASKMSGPREASLNIVWHFPTFRVGRVPFGFTADPENPCLAMQHRKIGADATVCSNDLIPIRANSAREAVYTPSSICGVDWKALIPENTNAVLEECVATTMRLLRYARVILLVGKHVLDVVIPRFQEENPDKEVKKVFLSVSGIEIYWGKPYIFVVLDKATQKVEKIFFVSFHLMAFFYIADQRYGIYHDFLWNTAAALASVPVVGKDVFFRATSPKRARAVGGRVQGQLALAIIHRGIEKSEGVILPDEVALQMFRPVIEGKNAD